MADNITIDVGDDNNIYIEDISLNMKDISNNDSTNIDVGNIDLTNIDNSNIDVSNVNMNKDVGNIDLNSPVYYLNDKIKHIVLTGGGSSGFTIIGVFNILLKQKYFNFDNIKTIYASSSGGIAAIVLLLGYDIDEIEKYFINKPWDKYIKFDPSIFTNLITNKGLISSEYFMNIVFESLLAGKNLDNNITLEEFYEYNNKELHLTTVNINNNFERVNLSYKTHPKLKLLTAIQMTMAIPFVFTPVFYEKGCYVDGGIIDNYPISLCIQETKCKYDEILGIKKNIDNITESNELKISTETNIIDVFMKYKNYISSTIQQNVDNIKYEINIYGNEAGLNDVYDCMKNKEIRKKLIEDGYLYAKLFISYMNNM